MENIIKKFDVAGEIVTYGRYGEGHINDTYLVVLNNEGNQELYIFQRINNKIFPNVEGLMNNIELVTSYLRNIITINNGDVNRETMNLIKTLDNKNYYFDGESYYRMFVFVRDTITLQIVENKEDFKESAIAFGRFQKLLKDFDATKLVEVIKDFHNTEVRFNHFLKTLELDKCDRAKECKEEIEFVLQRKEDCLKVIRLIEEKKIPLKVTHNDTKLNNVLLDKDTKKGVCVIDLDTVMPGSSLYDFGDSIRFGCNTASEDEVDLSKVTFSLEYFEAYVEGFLSEVRDSLNEYEKEYLAYSAKLLTLECGIRFLDDYLDGDNYFKIHREKHNLDRCRTQFKLVKEMEEKMEIMNSIVKKYL